MVAAFVMSPQHYMVRLPLLPWRQRTATVLSIIKSLAPAADRLAQPLPCVCRPFREVCEEKWRWLDRAAAKAVNRLFENTDKCHEIIPDEFGKTHPFLEGIRIFSKT